MMPALFIGHGSPMNALGDNAFARGWTEAVKSLPRPRAVLCVSAHWETHGVAVTAAERPETIHDFYGFPPELFAVRYPAPGDPGLSRRVAELLPDLEVKLDPKRGLDHGAWSVLGTMYPKADVPVVQLSLNRMQPPSFHYALGKRLASLRSEGVLILGSGNMVHNLGNVDFRKTDGFNWAVSFNEVLKEKIRAHDDGALIRYTELAPEASLAIPTPEHYLPLLYVLALRTEREEVSLFNDSVVLGSMSMTSVLLEGENT